MRRIFSRTMNVDALTYGFSAAWTSRTSRWPSSSSGVRILPETLFFPGTGRCRLSHNTSSGNRAWIPRRGMLGWSWVGTRAVNRVEERLSKDCGPRRSPAEGPFGAQRRPAVLPADVDTLNLEENRFQSLPPGTGGPGGTGRAAGPGGHRDMEAADRLRALGRRKRDSWI